MRRLILCLVLILSAADADARLSVDTTRGVVGEVLRVPVRLHGMAEPTVLRGLLKLGNPTVLYPHRFEAARPGAVAAWRLERLTDSTYRFELHVDSRGGDTVCYLAGEALAGSDSLCRLVFSELDAGGVALPDTTGVVLVTSVGTPLPYVRFARLEPNYPNPAIRNSVTTWSYRIDKPSAVTLLLYDLGGRVVHRFDMGDMPRGVHLVPYRIPVDMAAGVYYARLITGSGESFQPFLVMP